ncbi:MAG: hypothetical protein ACWGMZ_12315, partial [Thermoguttaceae bacterium]
MFCYQCEQTSKGVGCILAGVCGKDENTATLQDLVIYAAKGIAMYAHRAAKLGDADPMIDRTLVELLFATVTNVDFDPQRLEQHLKEAARTLSKAKTLYQEVCNKVGKTSETLGGPAAWQPADSREGLLAQGREAGVAHRQAALGNDVAGLQELILYGLKGAAAYADHALILGRQDPAVFAIFHEALDFLTHEQPTTDELLAWALKIGELNFK